MRNSLHRSWAKLALSRGAVPVTLLVFLSAASCSSDDPSPSDSAGASGSKAGATTTGGKAGAGGAHGGSTGSAGSSAGSSAGKNSGGTSSSSAGKHSGGTSGSSAGKHSGGASGSGGDENSAAGSDSGGPVSQACIDFCDCYQTKCAVFVAVPGGVPCTTFCETWVDQANILECRAGMCGLSDGPVEDNSNHCQHAMGLGQCDE